MTDTKIKRIDYDDHPEFATGQVWSQAEMKWIEAALEAARQIALKGRADNSLATVKALCDERDDLRAKLQVATGALEWVVRVNACDHEYQQYCSEALAKIKGEV